jgi:drug/metabolite transporter (DMT)-like permease
LGTDRKDHLDGLAVVLLLSCCALWGVNQVATKVALAEIPPLMQAAARSAGAALLLWGWSGWRGIPLWQRDGTLGGGLLAGLLFAVEFGCMFVGLQYTTASRMVVFLYLAPFVVALGMPLISRSERLDRWQALGLAMAFGGVVWAFAEGLGAGGRSLQWWGDALGVAAAVLWGLTTLVMRGSRLATAAPEKTLLYQLGLSAVALGLAAVVAGEPWPLRVSPLSLAALGFQTVIVTFASYLVWFWLIRHYPATRVSAFTLLTPVFGLLAGVLLLGDPVTCGWCWRWPRYRVASRWSTVCSGALAEPVPPPEEETPHDHAVRLCAVELLQQGQARLLEKGMPFQEEPVAMGPRTRPCCRRRRWARCRSSAPTARCAKARSSRLDRSRSIRSRRWCRPTPLRRPRCASCAPSSTCTSSWSARAVWPGLLRRQLQRPRRRSACASSSTKNIAAFKRLAKFSPYVAGDTFTLADCSAYASLPWWPWPPRRCWATTCWPAGIDWKGYVKLLGERASVQRVRPTARRSRSDGGRGKAGQCRRASGRPQPAAVARRASRASVPCGSG